MQIVSLITDALPRSERADSWQSFICDRIHRVSTTRISEKDFAAKIVARSYAHSSCATFWSKSHEVRCGREHLSDSGHSSYLVSFQLEGESHIDQGDNRFVLHPGQIAIVDGRREMSVRFPTDVRRVVAKLPAAAVERTLPVLVRRHTLHIEPAGFFSGMLLGSLTELANQESELSEVEAALIVENICNLLACAAGRAGIASASSRDLQRDAITRFIRQHASEASLRLEQVAAGLNISRRLVQQLLKEADTTFTELLMDERLGLARRLLTQTTARPISEIAYRCGFGDLSHFNHVFKARFGRSPRQVREHEGLAH